MIYMTQNESEGDVIDRLVLFRKNFRLSREELGRKLGVSDATIRNYEIRRSRPSLQCLYNLCDIYNINRDWLINGKGDMCIGKTDSVDTNIGDRLHTIRTHNGLSQGEFAQSINLSRGGYVGIERNINNATDRVISDVCRVYGVKEKWLRTGEGEMYEDHSEDMDLAAQLNSLLSDEPKKFRRRLITALLKLSDEQIDILAQVLDDLAASQDDDDENDI